ncbi:MAG TPA: hypothetical protein VH442_00440, partial [Micromonosporaceae bacterium]
MTAGAWPDLRLVGLTAGVWIAAIAALHGTPAGGVVLAAATATLAAVVAGTASVIARVRRRWPSMVAGSTALVPGAFVVAGSRRVGAPSARSVRLAGVWWPAAAGSRGRVFQFFHVVTAALPALRWVAVTMLIGAGCGAAATAAQLALARTGPVVALARQHAHATVALTVTSDPRPVGKAGAGPPTYGIDARLTRVATGSMVATTSVRVFVLAANQTWRGLLPGQRVIADVRLGPSLGADLDAAVVSVTVAPTL